MDPRNFVVTILVLAAFISSSLCLYNSSQIDPLVFEEQLLWVSGTQGEVNTFRIPLITFTTKGSLLAFVEARKFSSSDKGAKFIAFRRSTDKGSTWSPSSFILDDVSSPDGLNLGSVVVDDEVGSVILIYSVCFHQYHCKPSSTLMVESRDDGLSWGSPKNLSKQIGMKTFVGGPGTGLQKRYAPNKGRLVVCGHGTSEVDGVFCILSDDHGRTWYNGGALKSIPYNQKKGPNDFNPDECQPIELKDGSIFITVRNQNNYHCRCRLVVRSWDGGLTLPVEGLFFDSELIDPEVAAGAVQKGGVVFFTNPSHETSRVNLTLRWSLTDGVSWVNKALQIWAGPSGYSCVTSLDSGSVEDQKYIYIVFEKGHKSTIETISFVKVHLYGGK